MKNRLITALPQLTVFLKDFALTIYMKAGHTTYTNNLRTVNVIHYALKGERGLQGLAVIAGKIRIVS